MKLRRLTALLLSLLILLGGLLYAWAEEDYDESYDIEDDYVEITDDMPDEAVVIKGTIDFPHLSMYTGEVLYNAKVVIDCGLRKEMDMESARLITVPDNGWVEVLDVEPDWLLARYKDKVGYLRRGWIYARPEAVDPVNTPPYGVYKYNYIATCNEPTPIQKAPGAGQEAYLTLGEGARISIIDIYEGWGRFYYWHGYGYVEIAKLRDLVNVSPTDQTEDTSIPIAAYTSYYSISTNKENIGRMKNIAVMSGRITRVYEPGEKYDCNKQAGPFSKGNGYFDAPILINGGTAVGSGGGTCQVSSTLFNVLLQLPGVTVLQRRAHQQSGAKYLPVGNDAAVGTDGQNLRFQNDYPFPIRLEATAQDGALTLVMYRAQ